MSEKNLKKINFPYSLSMDTATPVDYNSFFTSVSAAEAAAKTAVEAGGYGSKYYIGQQIVVADIDNEIVKYYKIDYDNSLKELAAEYTVGRGLSSYIDSIGNTVIQMNNEVYNNVQSVFTSTKIASANWNKSYNSMLTLSSRWEDTSTYVEGASAKNDSLYNTIESVSAKWNNAYSTQSTWGNRWTSAYLTMVSMSSRWETVYHTVHTLSSNWQSAYNSVIATSADNASVYSTVYGTSGNWNDAFDTSNKIYDVIPLETWDSGNTLADKNYVLDKIHEQSTTFRGSFSTWSSVPTTSASYNSDIHGIKTPQNGDYMIVLDDSENTTTVLVDSNPVGEICSEDVTDYYSTKVIVAKGKVLDEDDITLLKTNLITSIDIYRTGTWRYNYNGNWSEGYEGKVNWKCEYRINNTTFTKEQIAAINSGITKQKADYVTKNARELSYITPLTGRWNDSYTAISEISSDAKSVYTTVESESAVWNTVVEKIAEDYFKYYTASAWAILTDDDTDYSDVPSGMVLIYEDDGSTPTPTKNLSIYTKDDGYLKFSKDITYDDDFGILYIGGNASFDFDTKTLTIPGSSDIASDTIYNYDTGNMKLGEGITWSDVTSSLTLGIGDTYDSETGIITLVGYGENNPVVSTYSVTNILTNAKTNNNATYVNANQQYSAAIQPISDSYYISSISCTMGGILVPQYTENTYFISAVSGDIVITAVGALKASTYYTVTNNLTNATTNNTLETIVELADYSAVISPIDGYSITSIICTMGGVEQTIIDNYISITKVTGDIVITAIAEVIAVPKVIYYTSTNTFRLATDASYDESTQYINLGASATDYTGNVLTFSGKTAKKPVSYASITNSLSNASTNNTLSRVIIGGSYIAKITADVGYTISSITCTMGGVDVTVSDDNEIIITSVSGNIIITATATYSGHSEYEVSSGIISLAEDATSTSEGIISLGKLDTFADDILTLNGYES